MLDIKTFVLAGNASFTCTAPNGDHYSYKVNRAKHNPKFPESAWFVNLGINYDSGIYMGMLKGDPPKLLFTKASRVGENSPSAVVFQALWWDALNGKNFAEPGASGPSIWTESGIRFQHEGRCCVCGRPLTNPISIDLGIGPECAERGGY